MLQCFVQLTQRRITATIPEEANLTLAQLLDRPRGRDSEDARRWARGMAQGVPEEGRGLRKRGAGKGRGARGAKGGRKARGGGGKGSGRKRFPWQ